MIYLSFDRTLIQISTIVIFNEFSMLDLGPSSRISVQKDSIFIPEVFPVSALRSDPIAAASASVPAPVPVPVPIPVFVAAPVAVPAPFAKSKGQGSRQSSRPGQVSGQGQGQGPCPGPSEQRAQWFVDPSSIQVNSTKLLDWMKLVSVL